MTPAPSPDAAAVAPVSVGAAFVKLSTLPGSGRGEDQASDMSSDRASRTDRSLSRSGASSVPPS